MVSWTVVYAKQASKDAKKLNAAGLKGKAQGLVAVLEIDPFQNTPPFEKLVGDRAGAYARRINIEFWARERANRRKIVSRIVS